jgi:hemolysin activation/secretion protein
MIKHNSHLRTVLAACVSFPVIVTATPSLAQSVQSRDQVDLTNPENNPLEPVQDPVRTQFTTRANCPFDDTLSVRIDKIDFLDPRGLDVPPELLESLSGIQAPGGTQSLVEVCNIRDAANDALRDDGWIATVQIPRQNLVDTLELNVVSARLTEVRLTGNTGPFGDQIAAQIEKLEGIYPLNERDAEQVLLLANEIPGISLELSLAPGTSGVGNVVGNLSVDFEPFTAIVNTRNYNSRTIGRETLFGLVEFYGITGLADRTFVAAQTTYDFEEQQLFQMGHDFALNASGLRFGTSVTYAISKPSIQDLDFEADTILADVHFTQPLLRRIGKSVDLTLGFEYADQETNVGDVPLSKDSTRAVYLRGDFAVAPSASGNFRTYSQGFLEVRQGLSLFDATSFGPLNIAETDGLSASRPFGDATSFILRGEAEFGFKTAIGFGANARVLGQWTENPLLNFDEFSIGNLTVGRGYDPGSNSGDRAIGLAAEVTQEFVTTEDFNLEAFAFYDVVEIENLDQGDIDPVRTLESVGGGLRFNLTKGVRAEVAYVEPLDRAFVFDAEKPPGRVLFSLTTRFPSLLR